MLPEDFPMNPIEVSGLLAELRAGVLIVSINRPAAGNGLTIEMSNALKLILSAASDDDRIRVLVLTGVGKHFSVGGDVSLIEENINLCRSNREEASALLEITHELATHIETFPKPVICAVNGAAAGMGLVLVLCSDIVVADPGARFVYAYTSVGLPGDGGAARRLASRIGVGRALEFAFFDEPVDAKKALSWGLVNVINTQNETTIERALNLAGRLANGPLIVLAGMKRCMRSEKSSRDHRADEIGAFIEAANHDDVFEGIAAIREKRKPGFSNSGIKKNGVITSTK